MADTHRQVQQSLSLLSLHVIAVQWDVFNLAALGKQQVGTGGQRTGIRPGGGANRGGSNCLVNTFKLRRGVEMY